MSDTPQHGTATATFTDSDGATYVLIVPATFYKGQMLLDADKYHMALSTMRAAGLAEMEFEFTATEDTEVA
ncbi:hypothetical protein OZ411_28750 [Bradyrhizobium sp. Arg237L]|uniref:hypothetical protein n=1 Tax=Bradyrhizobium sp. Arg237L TaxID=3003352 RepID=UPI00249EF049|nr:hypothetical protein [Bradyrhizobium sp. Arg237L]MDI4236807.1 hypothetical protein [Bradyrhizobium sp. Arg237L]